MHESIYLVNPIIKVQVICGISAVIGRLLRALGETIWSMLSTWDVNECKMEEEYGDNPVIDAGRWHEVGVC